jgi:hypothetical protein
MELQQYQTQIFASLALILAACAVALICDYLKGRNEKLRELAVELKVRREESDKLVNMLASQDSPLVTPPSKETVLSLQATGPERERDLSRAHAPSGRQVALPPPVIATQNGQKRLSPEAMIGIIRNALKARTRADAPKPEPAPAFEPAAQIVPPAEVRPVQEPAHETSVLLDPAIAATAGPIDALSLPSGLQPASVLKRLVDSEYRVSGLIVSISVTTPSQSETASEFPDAVRSAIGALLNAGEFASPTGSGEFVVISPHVRGALAQRRLSRITQHLWDMQLGSLGQFQLQFIWGGLEVRDEAIQDALDSAAERMQAARHSRNLVTLAVH